MLSTTATTWSRVAWIHVRLGSGLNGTSRSSRGVSARLDDELLRPVVDLGGGAGGLDERQVDHDVTAADVPLPDDHLELDVAPVGEPLALDTLRRGERHLVRAGP